MRIRGLFDLTIRSIKEQRLLVLLICIYISATIPFCIVLGSPAVLLDIIHSAYIPMLTIYLFFYFVYRSFYVFIRSGSQKGFPLLWQDLKKNQLTSARLIYAIPPLLAIPFFGNAFSIFKTMIPLFDPFSWDPVFISWDKALHGGRHPWEWLQLVLGKPWISYLINILYNSWFIMFYSVLFWQIFNVSRPSLRRQYLLTFCSLWIVLGTASASFFASAGPWFFDQVANLSSPYHPLMDYLHRADKTFPLFALNAQNWLWENYVNNNIRFATGISAMPSLHVAIAFLNALLGWRYNRALGWSLSLFALAILLGSVHLAWHYAIDGYVAIVGAWFLWRFFGWYEKKHPLSDDRRG